MSDSVSHGSATGPLPDGSTAQTSRAGCGDRPASEPPRPPHRGPEHAAPGECPVCGDHLVVTRLGCTGCGSELAGTFASCDFCALSLGDRALLGVFLSSRGNLREVERHLQVSYPTARARFTELLERIGLADGEGTAQRVRPPAQPGDQHSRDPSFRRDQILFEVASGALAPGEAARLLRQVSQGG